MTRLPANYPRMLNIEVANYESGVFQVGQTIVPIPPDSVSPVDWENIMLLYKGDYTRGSALLGIGMIKKILADGHQSVTVYRTGETPVYPDINDDNGEE